VRDKVFWNNKTKKSHGHASAKQASGKEKGECDVRPLYFKNILMGV